MQVLIHARSGARSISGTVQLVMSTAGGVALRVSERRRDSMASIETCTSPVLRLSAGPRRPPVLAGTCRRATRSHVALLEL